MRDPGSGLGGSGEPAPRGRKPPADSEFYSDWAKGNIKEFNKTANAFLSQILSLSASLLAGSIALWKILELQWSFKVLMVVLWSVCVCVSLFSFAPIEGGVDPGNPSDVRDHMEVLFAAKRRRIAIVKWSFAFAVVIATVGLLIGDTIQVDKIWSWVGH
jgi:hypothetical protein